MPNNLENTLIDKASKATDFFENGQETAAIGKLGAFINQVNARRGNPLTNAEADALIAIAQIITDAINDETADCNNPGPQLLGFSQNAKTQLTVAPNPFESLTTIQFSIEEDTHVSLIVYDISGNRVKVLIDEFLYNGNHQIAWNAHDESGKIVPSGIYYFQIQAGTFAETRSIIRVQ